MTLENGGCYCNGGCDKPDFSELEPVLDEYAKIPGSLITILQRAQDIYGYLSMDAINYISKNRFKTGADIWSGTFLYPV